MKWSGLTRKVESCLSRKEMKWTDEKNWQCGKKDPSTWFDFAHHKSLRVKVGS